MADRAAGRATDIPDAPAHMPAWPRHALVPVGQRTFRFPLYSTRREACERPEAVVEGTSYCRRSANNVLMVGPPQDLLDALPGWKDVGARPRWNAMEGTEGVAWQANDASLMPRGHHRFVGIRDHLRVWRAHDGSYAIGQAHRDAWEGLLRRHHVVTGLGPTVHALEDAMARAADPPRLSYEQVGSEGKRWDGNVLIADFSG